jgi:uncharacterized membrane protein
MMGEYFLLLVAALIFTLTHLGISSTAIRPMLLEILGENGYLGFYSLIAFATLGALIFSYGEVGHQHYLWQPTMLTGVVAKLIMPISLILIVTGLTAKNPTSVKMESAVDLEPQGILRITRHPLQWGIMLWAVSHLIANGDIASIIFFLTFMIVSGYGTTSIDRKRRLTLDEEKWSHFTSLTSNVPLAAIVSGRNKLEIAELGWIKIVVSLILFVALVYFHELIANVPLYSF